MGGNQCNSKYDIALLEIIYGEYVKPIFSNMAFVWDADENRDKGLIDSLNGTIVTLDGQKVINETVDNVIELIDKEGNIVGYVLFINGKFTEYKNLEPGNIVTEKILAIVDSGKFKYIPVRAQFYTKEHPDLIIEYNFKKYTLKYDGNKPVYFKAIT